MFRIGVGEEDVERVLAEWRGADCQVAAYNPSHRRLIMRMTRPDSAATLAIGFTGCARMQGPFSWHNAQLTIANDTSSPYISSFCRAADGPAGFSLISASAAMCILTPGSQAEHGRAAERRAS